tara:strand:+ start:254 stop:889 length:636 start_codon:yes stop_codon:yes gene_type:complete
LKKIVITIDGPAASGKEKIAKYISRKWKYKHLDSGNLYRNLAYTLLKNKIDLESINQLKKIINNIKSIPYRKHKKIRTEKVSKIASKIAVHGFIRNYINQLQRDFVNYNLKTSRFVIDGRDIGSVVFKNADLKLYIDVNEKNRAKRRYKQLIDTGEKSIYPQILKDIKLRDKKDKTRKNSPLVVPKGAFIINNNLSFKNTTNQINSLIRKI